jgi:DNA (cytosine-5)-methyltransferase 1
MRTLQIGDMFCGAGGSTTGIRQAIDAMGHKAKIWAFNHWNIAIDTHSSNYADVNHICASVEQLDPTKIFPGRELDLLWASPACTHHSVARGGRPRCEQQRVSAWIILHWLENLKVKRVIIENVPEFRNWGPLDDDGRIIKDSKGLTFQAFISGIKSLGYSVDYRVLNAADYGDPTVRRRLFIQAIKGTGREITWPHITHANKQDEINLPQWIPAREIIDWSLHGESIFSRKKPLAPATIRRIEHGIMRFWHPYAEPFLIMLRGTGTSRSVDKPLPSITAQGKHLGLVTPFLINNYGQSKSGSIEEPLPTVVGSSPKTALIDPFILPNEGYYRGNKARSLNQPFPTVTASRGAGALIEPFITRFHGGQDSEKRNHSIDSPLPVIDTSNRYGIVEPFITAIGQSSAKDRSRSIHEPLSTVVSKAEHCLIEPFLVKYYGTGGATSLDQPIGTITGKEHFALVEPDVEYAIDIRFRMLQPHEEAAAMSFPKEYLFRGNKGDIQKQIGNAVPVRLSRALAENILSVEVV